MPITRLSLTVCELPHKKKNARTWAEIQSGKLWVKVASA